MFLRVLAESVSGFSSSSGFGSGVRGVALGMDGVISEAGAVHCLTVKTPPQAVHLVF